VRLLETWHDFDAQGALSAIRHEIRLGSISLDQRKPREVAELLRRAARSVGDADGLRDAYEAMARAPLRKRDASALLALLADLDREAEGPSESELRAIGVPIIIQAYKCATDDALLTLVPVVERYVRAFIRQKPPNLEFAHELEPVLAGAHDRSSGDQREGIENLLRELAGVAPVVVKDVEAPQVATTYEEVLHSFDGRSAGVEIMDSAFESARSWGREGREYLSGLRDALEAIVAVADRYASRQMGTAGLVGAFSDAGQKLIPDESESTRQDPKTRAAHTARNRRGQPVVLGPHLKFGAEKRLYLSFDEARRLIYVGWVGQHLRVRKFH
jgi:hypothetical protein